MQAAQRNIERPPAASRNEQHRRRRGLRADAWGRSAEELVARRYEAMGASVLARRARTEAGEIDLVLEMDGAIVFAEVKARRSLEEALRAAPRGWGRRGQAALAYAAAMGHAGDIRLDLAAVDRAGEVEILPNAGMEAAF